MEKQNRFLSFELLLALLFIIAFFLPWLDWGMVKVVGWDIPELQKKLIKVSNFFKFFSKNKDWIYSTHVVYIIPLLSFSVIILWIFLKQRASRIFLMVTGVFGIIVSINLLYKLPKAGSGVYLLTASSIVSIIYVLFVFFRKKKKDNKLELIDDISPTEIEITEE